MFIAEKSSRTVLKIPYPKIIRLLSNCLEFETLIHFFQLIKSVFNFSFPIIWKKSTSKEYIRYDSFLATKYGEFIDKTKYSENHIKYKYVKS